MTNDERIKNELLQVTTGWKEEAYCSYFRDGIKVIDVLLNDSISFDISRYIVYTSE